MKAESDSMTVKRRSPLSISAMRPLHPLLGGLERETEPVVFDRSSKPENHIVRVFQLEGSKRVEIPQAELSSWLTERKRSLGPKYYNPTGQTRATGLYVYDIAIDLRTLFCVSTNRLEPELYPEIETKLRDAGWKESQNAFGKCLVLPKVQREKVIPALAHALINWRITSNQSRTFSLMETLAIAMSDNANHIAYSIRASLRDDIDKPAAFPVLDESGPALLFITPSASGRISGVQGSVKALENAEAELVSRLNSFSYDSQV